MTLDGATIAVTGGSGLVGSRFCEVVALEHPSARLVVLARNVGRAARIGRLPISLLRGSVTERETVREAISSADVVVHLATGGAGGIVHGTRIVAEEALRRGVPRFVHMSSAAVHGLSPTEQAADEATPLRMTGNPYSDAKIRAERAVHKLIARGLPAVILRPRVILGPYSWWVEDVLREGLRGRVTLIDGGRGACNTVFIDNLVNAITLAADPKSPAGGTYLITDGEPLTWGEFKVRLLEAAGLEYEIRHVASESVLGKRTGGRVGWIKANAAGLKRVLGSPEGRHLLRQIPAVNASFNLAGRSLKLLPRSAHDRFRATLAPGRPASEDPPHGGQPPSPDEVMRQRGTGFASIARARRDLGYAPRVPLQEGFRLTGEWIRWREAWRWHDSSEHHRRA
jgi:nucleoside-diphosphate-sugar epimerase